jgi:hypothetical protein
MLGKELGKKENPAKNEQKRWPVTHVPSDIANCFGCEVEMRKLKRCEEQETWLFINKKV